MTDLHQTVLAKLRTSDEGLPFWALRPLHESGGAVQEVLRDLEAASRIARDPETERYRLSPECPGEPAAITEHVGAAGIGPWEDPTGRGTRHVRRDGAGETVAEAYIAGGSRWWWTRFEGVYHSAPAGSSSSAIEGAKAAADEALVLSSVERGSLWTTPAAPGAGGLPAAKIPASLVDVRILTLDDVAEPLPHALPSMPVPPRGHPAHGVGPGWSERIAALEGALRLVDVALAGHTARIRDLEERLRAMGVEL